ncbi:MAG: M28 family peptidase [Bacteroides sp.]|nr:M28 family peptidase [Bacillota bacterium]MCM1393798.1 M28 family peptidase [[Eubacterium] siraeum]MCM1455117.1 M28 family peptidase [Bacteroides sp.]
MTTDKNQVANKICADIKHVCKTYGSRNAGGEGERLASEYFYQELSANADEIVKEEFKLNPAAFKGWIPISVTCAMVGIVAYFFSSLVALMLFIVGIIPFLFEYVLHMRMLDPLYPEKTSQNITALKKCSEEPKKRLYFVANTDASFENSIKYRFGGVVLMLVIVFDLLGVAYFVALSIARWAIVGGLGASIASGIPLYVGLAGLIFVPSLFSTYFMISEKVIVDGANSNLTGCFAAVRAFGALKDVEMKNTEVGVILTGGGACGLRGSKAWCDLHASEVDKENTVFIALNSLRELASLNVTGVEMYGLVRGDKEIANLVQNSAKNINLHCANHRIPFEASDSATFRQRGFKSGCICAANLKLPEYFSTRYDSYDNLSEECIAECYALAIEIIKQFSNEEIDVICEPPSVNTEAEYDENQEVAASDGNPDTPIQADGENQNV